MKKLLKNNTGITLIVLVITVIVLLILSGISITAFLGDNGIIENTDEAKVETEISQYREKLEYIKHQEYADEYTIDIDNFLGEYAEAVKKDKMFKEAKEVTPDYTNKVVIVVTKEGYRFEVTIDDTTYIGEDGSGEGGGNAEVDINKVNISIIATPENWTNGKVKVKLKSNVTGITKEYSLDEGASWNTYENEIEVENNGTVIQARGKNAKGETTKIVTKRIENIDRLAPNTFTPIIKGIPNQITVKCEVTDKEATNTDGKSGIKGYKFSKDNGKTWTEMKSVSTHVYYNLKQGEGYPIKVKAIDNAGNEIDSEVVMGWAEEEIPDAEGRINFEKNPTTWTQGPVRVKMNTTDEKHYTQYSYDDTNYKDYEQELEIKDNKLIYGRLARNGRGGKSTSYKVDNIDKLPPKEFVATVTNATSKSLSIQGTTTDAEATETDGKSEIRGYKFSKDNGASWTEEQKEGTYTFDGLKSGTTYNVIIKAIDNAGNERNSKILQAKTAEIPSNTINFSYYPTGWTNKNVTVTIGDSSNNYTLQYSLNGKSWNNYDENAKVTMQQNGPVYARLTDGINYGATVTGNVNNIDKTAPKVTFGTNGSTTYRKSQSTTVTVKDDGGSSLNTNTLRYQWSQSTIQPAENTFTNSFSNGGTVTKNSVTGNNWYLWVLSKDNAGNTTITKTNPFYLDNIGPTGSMSPNGGNVTLRDGGYYCSRCGYVSYNHYHCPEGHSGTSSGSTICGYTWTTTEPCPGHIGQVSETWINGNYTCDMAGCNEKAQRIETYGCTICKRSYGAYNQCAKHHLSDVPFYADPCTYTVEKQKVCEKRMVDTSTKESDEGEIRTTISVTDPGGSGRSDLKYAWSRSNTSQPSSWTSFYNGETIYKTVYSTDTWYLWIKMTDGAGNTTVTVSNPYYVSSRYSIMSQNLKSVVMNILKS